MNNLMKMIICILFLASNLNASNTPTKGSTLQVLAPSGLKLRTAPTMNSGAIAIMPHGAEVVLIEFDQKANLTRIDWIDGKWIKVAYKGFEGWAFDGFLTILHVPEHELEKCYGDLDLSYPVEFWTRGNFPAISIDTITDGETFVTTKYNLVQEQLLQVTERDVSTRVELHLDDVRIMEVYQLLASMIDSKVGVKAFKDASIFIEKDGTIKHIKIDVGGGIDIRESYDGQVRVTIDQYIGC